MFNISSFLEKISKNLKNNQINKNQIIEILNKKINIYLKEEDIEVKNCILFINTSPAVKNKIFINKESLLFDLNKITNIVNIK